MLIQKWAIALDDKYTSKDDRVDLPHPLVPHKSIVTDSFLSLILIGTVEERQKRNVTTDNSLKQSMPNIHGNRHNGHVYYMGR